MRVLLSGGGTAGHINPALAIADYFKRRDTGAQFLFVGTERGMENVLVPKAGYEMRHIEIQGLKRSLSAENLRLIRMMIRAKSDCKKIIEEFKPDIVIATGGYVCVPAAQAAIKKKIPVIVHEQNVFPGLAVKMLAKDASVTAISFDETRSRMRAKRFELTGNPLREELFGENLGKNIRAEYGFSEKPVVLMFGGSLGAGLINEALVQMLSKGLNRNFNLLAGVGERFYDEVIEKLAKGGIDPEKTDGVKILPYIYDMKNAMNGADLIVSRAGAITVSEITALGKAAVLLPSKFVAHNHQEFNARFLEKGGAARVILDDDLNGERLAEEINSVISKNGEILRMAAASRKMGIRDANEKIYNLAKELTR